MTRLGLFGFATGLLISSARYYIYSRCRDIIFVATHAHLMTPTDGMFSAIRRQRPGGVMRGCFLAAIAQASRVGWHTAPS